MSVRTVGRPREGGSVRSGDEPLVKVTFKIDGETARALDFLVERTMKASTSAGRRRMRSEVIRRAVLIAAAAVATTASEADRPPPDRSAASEK